jgi:hypothetical protein
LGLKVLAELQGDRDFAVVFACRFSYSCVDWQVGIMTKREETPSRLGDIISQLRGWLDSYRGQGKRN